MADDDKKQTPVVTEKPSVPQTGFGLQRTDDRATEKTEMQRATAQVYASHQRAIQYPRDENRCVQRIFDLCANVHFAAGAMYRVPRGNDKVEGFNIGSAKEFARIWGNMEYGTVSHGDYGNVSQFEAYAHDLETNVPFRSSYTVKHQRWVDKKNVDVIDPQGIDELCKARNSKEVRNAIMSQLPGYVKDEALKIVKRTLHEAVQDVPSAWSSCKTKFEKMGVNTQSLCRFLNKPLNKVPGALDASDIVELRFLYDAIKNDRTILDTTFPERDKTKIPAVAAAKEEGSSTETKPAASTKPAGTKPPSNPTPSSKQSSTKSDKESSTTSTPAQTPAETAKSVVVAASQETTKGTAQESSESGTSDEIPCVATCPLDCPNHEQLSIERSEEDSTSSQEALQSDSEQSEESTPEQEEDDAEEGDELQEEDVF